MPSRHHKRSYRITAITLAYLLFGTAIFVPLGMQVGPNLVLLFVLLGIWFLLLVGTIVINEIIIKKKYGGDFLPHQEEEEEAPTEENITE